MLVEADLQDVLPTGEAESAHVLAARPTGAILEPVPEHIRLPRPQPRVEQQLRHDHPGLPLPPHPPRTAVLPGQDLHPPRVAPGVSVMDGHVPVHPVPMGTNDMLRRAADEAPVGPDPYGLVVAHRVQPAVRRTLHPGEQCLQHRCPRHQ